MSKETKQIVEETKKVSNKKELRKGSAELVKVILEGQKKPIEISEDMALVLLKKDKCRLCQ